MLTGLLSRLVAGAFRLINRRIVWYRLPFALAVVNLLALRTDLRNRNLFDTETAPPSPEPPPDFDVRRNRTADGSFNDLGKPWMGMAGTRFGRNAPLAETHGEKPPGLYEPNPRVVSNELLARRDFIPAETVNVLLPAWLQFMVHDWLNHGPNDKTDPHLLPKPESDDWPADNILVLRTRHDKPSPEDRGRPATTTNDVTHWWDGSQIYGSTLERQRLVRSGRIDGEPLPDGKLALDDNGHLPRDPSQKAPPDQELAAVNGNWWLGLSVMHTLFAREHNAIVDRLKAEYPYKDGEWLFQKARLVNAALIIKIHAVEWTPALLQMPALQYAMRGSWWGVLGEGYAKTHGRPARSEVLSGIPSSPQEHHSAPYAITEEFTSVYRLHTLVPDEFALRRHRDDTALETVSLEDVFSGGTMRLYGKHGFDDILYSLGSSFAGAPVLHNFPTLMRRMKRHSSETDLTGDNVIYKDAASIDILRDRERGVPRYCALRRALRMSVPKTFAELTDNEDWQRELKAVYGDVEKVDVLTGVHAETKPPGFAISDTAFRIFILMAGRRIKSDRFLTDSYTPDVYTQAGVDWVENNGMREVILRHCPELEPRVADVRNMFFPWPRAGS